jgi:hypothetical protein
MLLRVFSRAANRLMDALSKGEYFSSPASLAEVLGDAEKLKE